MSVNRQRSQLFKFERMAIWFKEISSTVQSSALDIRYQHLINLYTAEICTFLERSFSEFFRPTWMEIELDQIKYNAEQIKKYIGNEVHLMAVVKANGYEYGDLEVSETAILGGASWLGVGTMGFHFNMSSSRS